MKDRESGKPSTSSLGVFQRGADENNLAEFPLALLSDSASPSQNTIEFQDTIKDWKTGKQVTRRVCVTSSDKYGLPTAKDEEVLVALLQLTKIANNFTDAEVWFNKHQIIELLGWENRGWAYDRVEESLHRWKDVSVHYWNAWRDHANGTWNNSEAIGIIEYFSFNDGRLRIGDRQHQSRFLWNRILFESFKAGYLKPLDFGVYRSLKRPASRRAYRFLDKRFFHEPKWEFNLQTFACEKLGFSRKYDTGQLKARLRPAMTELEQIGFIEPVEYRKTKPKCWMIAVQKKVGATAAETSPNAATSPPETVVTLLIARGVAATTAQQLVEQFAADQIQSKIDYVDWLAARNDKRISGNPPGFLVAAIRNDYPLPKDYLKSLAKKPVSASAKTPRIAKKSTATVTVEKSEVEKYLEGLTVEQRSTLEAEAVAAADPITADGYRRSQRSRGQSFAAYQKLAIERYVRQLMKSVAGAD